MATLTGIINKISSYIISNMMKLITAQQVKEIFTDLKNYIADDLTFFGNIKVFVTQNTDISQINHDDIINGIKVSAGDYVFLMAQTDSSQNGLYVVGQNAGGTIRHADFSSELLCHKHLFQNKNYIVAYAAGTYTFVNNGASTDNTIVINTTEPEMPGRQYQSFANAWAYIDALETPPSDINPWVIKFSGYIAENLTGGNAIREYCQVQGETLLASLLAGDVSFIADGEGLFANIISNCFIANLIANTIEDEQGILVTNCHIANCSSVGDNSILFNNSYILDGDFSGFAEANFLYSVIQNITALAPYTAFKNSIVNQDIDISDGVVLEINASYIENTLTILDGGVVINKGSYLNETPIIEAGGTLQNNIAFYDNTGTELDADEAQAAISELAEIYSEDVVTSFTTADTPAKIVSVNSRGRIVSIEEAT